MIKADEAKKITNEAIERQKEKEKKIMENFLIEAEKDIKEVAEKGQRICYLRTPKEYKYKEYEIINTLREYDYVAHLENFESIRVSW